jgi:hypothetical protein
MVSGKRASMVCRVDANGARSIWPCTPPKFLGQISVDEEIDTLTADGAYDTRSCHTAIIDRQTTAIIPVSKNGRPWKEDCPAATARNEILRATRH